MGQVSELGHPEGNFAADSFLGNDLRYGRRQAERPVPEHHGGDIREIGKNSHGNTEVAEQGKGEILILFTAPDRTVLDISVTPEQFVNTVCSLLPDFPDISAGEYRCVAPGADIGDAGKAVQIRGLTSQATILRRPVSGSG